MAQVVEHLPGKNMALISSSNSTILKFIFIFLFIFIYRSLAHARITAILLSCTPCWLLPTFLIRQKINK
jgi:hypothetical protein